MEPSLILVGIDFSEAAALAVGWARDLARWGNGRILAVHVADRDEWTWTPERRDWLAGAGLGPAEVVVRTGTPWLQLARYADEVRPTLVVVGSHGRGGYHPVAPGTTATMLLTRVRMPVVVVPPSRSAAGPPTPRDTMPEPRRGAEAPPTPPAVGHSFHTESNRS